MSRKSFAWTCGFTLLTVSVIVLAVGLMLRHEPDFYRRAALPAGQQRQQWSTDFRSELTNLIGGIINDKKWGARFTEEQINSYFEEDYLRLHSGDQAVFPDKVSAPRVVFDQDRVRLGFRYGGKRWSTVVTLDLNVWLAANEPNVIALEVQSMRVGAVPIALQSVLERFAESIRRQGSDVEMSWYRYNNRPVALLRFGSGRKDPTVYLQHLKLVPGAIAISGADRTSRAAATEPAAGANRS